MKKLLMIAGLINLISLAACGQKTYEEQLESLYKNSVPLMQSEELLELLKANEDVVILDTRSPKEFKVSHINNACMVDYESFKINQIDSIPKNTKVIVYCSVGYRSEKIGEKLIKAGYKDVSNLYGGIFQWKNENEQVVNHVNAPTDSVHTYNKSWSKWLKKGIKVYE